jgi:hypothetical protein
MRNCLLGGVCACPSLRELQAVFILLSNRVGCAFQELKRHSRPMEAQSEIHSEGLGGAIGEGNWNKTYANG